MKKILVANRGEIALRVMKSIKKMGIKAVAIYSEADRNAPHVSYSDEAICIGPPPSNQSYLLGDKIIEEALKIGVDGIHPGYGFLSENATFARNVVKAGINFIGPSPESMEIMGSKLAAKDAVKDYSIPMVPGVDRAVVDPNEAKAIAKEIGFPVLIKASAGGGGKGMRIVENEGELEAQMERAISEAISSFGDGAVFVEKYIKGPRHIEIQVLADQHGNSYSLFERECSIQRRHQKVVEEAPSGILTPEIRKAMGEDAVKVAKACDYVGAGTVEFLLDADLNYYFLEMNTRLQVEHPVTEWITGIDLVEQQIRVARGEKLAFAEEDLQIKGHAVELRIYAEDPLNDFLPSVGKIETYSFPEGPDIRLDSGYTEGMDIPIYYDPMIAKLITYGDTREAACQKMREVLNQSKISGVATTLPFGQFVFQHEAFLSAQFDTGFVKQYFDPEILVANKKEEAQVAAQLAAWLYQEEQKKLKVPDASGTAW